MAWHMMVDLETWGTLPGSSIRSIGAVLFDPVTGRLGHEFYANIDRESARRFGLVEDPKTVSWWSEQSAEAQAALADNPEPLGSALLRLAHVYRADPAERLWSHGACFDEPILRVAYRACGLEPPWKFWDVRDTRTVYELGGVKPDKADGLLHHALDDARRQARAVIDAYARLQRGWGPSWSALEARVRLLERDSHPPIDLGDLARAAADAAVARVAAGGRA